jgi:hypothetical protein
MDKDVEHSFFLSSSSSSFFFFGEIIVDFPTETLILRRAWSEVFQELKENNFSPKILYPAKLSFKTEGE